jgi:adenylosuccinate lyase
MIGRTHGQHALPITLGFKFAVWGYEVNRHIERLKRLQKTCPWRAKSAEQSEPSRPWRTCRANPRPRHETFRLTQRKSQPKSFNATATPNSSASTLKSPLPLKTLPQKSVNYNAPKSLKSLNLLKQKNRSAAQLCLTSRILKPANASAALPESYAASHFQHLEDMVTWHERDLTQSSTERFVLPESNILLDYILELNV